MSYSVDPWTAPLHRKVPEVTVLFWVATVLSATVAGTAARVLSTDLALRLPATTAVTGVLLGAVLVAQLAVRRHVSALYWTVLVLAGVLGTELSQSLAARLGAGAGTALAGVALGACMGSWYASERTVSVPSVRTRRREAYYWLTVLLSLVLGASAGALVTGALAVGLPTTALLFALTVATVAVSHQVFEVSAVPVFWLALVVTRPFGSSVGDLLAAGRADGGLGLGTTATSLLFLGVVVSLVGWFSLEHLPDTQAARAESQRDGSYLAS